MWLELCRNDFRRVSDRLNRCIESTSACFESPHKETTVNGYIILRSARDLAYFRKACHAITSPNMCRCQMRSCMGNCAISRLDIVEKYLIYSKNYSFPHKNEEKTEF